MIYLISNQQELYNDNNIYTRADIKSLEAYLGTVTELGLDCETDGMDPHTSQMLSLQLGDAENQYVIDTLTVNISFLKPHLENKLIIGQNLKFDLKFLYKKGIYIRKIWDTFVSERVLYCGIPDHRAGLDWLTDRYLGFKLDKSVRADIKKEGLSSRVIKYGADDIKYLSGIKEKQIEELKERGLGKTAALENRFTPALAYVEYCGFKLDRNKWLEKMAADKARFNEARLTLDNWVIQNKITKFINTQIDLFDSSISCSVNWASPKQMVTFFEHLGIDCSTVEKGVAKKSVEESVIAKYKKEFKIVELYLNYKKEEKIISTYGQTFLEQINPVTGRVHTNFKQIMNTGRISSGGKDKATKEEYINFQNIPSDKFTRSCFVAEEGNILIICDYSGQEQIVLANKSLDSNLLKFYDEGLADMHSFVASKMYPELEGLSLDDIKSAHKDKRQNAKTAGFAINYGGVGATIAANNNISIEEGNKIYEAYFKAFPGLKVYFEKVKKQGLRDGYILISDITGRKSYIPNFSKFKELEEKMDDDFWQIYRREKSRNSELFLSLKKQVSEYFQIKGGIERDSLNYPIQGTAAEITKISCIYIFDYIVDNNLFWIVKFVNTIHDENVLECPVTMSKRIADMVRDSMFKAGAFYCKRVPLKAEPDLSTYWRK